MADPERAWARSLYRRSIVKKEKLRNLVRAIGESCSDRRCLDVGGDNGVASLVLRDLGGEWHSVEADATAAEAVRRVVGGDVRCLDGVHTGFPSDAFDLVVVVDMLEHLEDDAGLVDELARITRRGGTLVVNVPRIVSGSWIPRIRRAVGLTDERHGHVRPGYTAQGLAKLLEPAFVVEDAWPYSREALELFDLVVNAGRMWLGQLKLEGNAPESRKGSLVTRDELGDDSFVFRLLALLNPALEGLAALDRRLGGERGHRMVMRARRTVGSA